LRRDGETDDHSAMHAAFDRDVFMVNQKQLALGKSKYFVYDEGGQPLLYVERPTMRLFGRKAPVTFFEDDMAKTPVLVAQQDQGWEFLKREYTLVEAGSETVLARLRRDNIKALFKRTWKIEDPSGALIAIAREDSTFMAVVRRVIDFIPFVGIIGFALLKTDFHILRVDEQGNERKIGSFDRKIGIADKYVLTLRDDPEQSFDRRVAVALGVLLDTAETR
jgi:hypothetical protein